MNDIDSKLIFEAYVETSYPRNPDPYANRRWVASRRDRPRDKEAEKTMHGPFGTKFKTPYHKDAVETTPYERLRSRVEEYLRKYVDRANFEMVADHIGATVSRVYTVGSDAGYKEFKLSSSDDSFMDAKQQGEFLDSYHELKSSAVQYLRQYVNLDNFRMVANEIEDIIEKAFNIGVASGRSSFMNYEYNRTGQNASYRPIKWIRPTR